MKILLLSKKSNTLKVLYNTINLILLWNSFQPIFHLYLTKFSKRNYHYQKKLLQVTKQVQKFQVHLHNGSKTDHSVGCAIIHNNLSSSFYHNPCILHLTCRTICYKKSNFVHSRFFTMKNNYFYWLIICTLLNRKFQIRTLSRDFT